MSQTASIEEIVEKSVEERTEDERRRLFEAVAELDCKSAKHAEAIIQSRWGEDGT